MTKWVSAWTLLAITIATACSSTPGVARFPVENISVPERVAEYSSAPQANGAAGGPSSQKLAAEVAAALASRGKSASADGALASTSCLALARVHNQRPIDTVTMDLASRRFGFAGVVTGAAAFDAQTDAWREVIARIPPNVTLNRFGVCASPSGRSAALVIGALEMQFETVPKDFEPGQQVALRGRADPRFTSAHVYLTKVDGSVEERKMASVGVDATFQLDVPGQYRLEVMGDGPMGPVIVANMPLYVGTVEPALPENRGVVVEPEVAEKRMLELLNEARKAAGAGPLLPDNELHELAAGHSEDMVDHNFVAHVSPSTGTPENRLRRSRILVSEFGENISFAPTPEDAHSGLMESPGHRANMLNVKFTHVGIAAAKTEGGLVITLNFGRRVRAEDVPTAAQLLAALTELRKAAGLATPSPDPIYSAGAQGGADAMASGASDADVAKAEAAAMQREVDRLRSSRPAACVLRAEILEVDQLKHASALISAQLRRYGIGARLRRDAKGARLDTVFMFEGCN